MGFFHIMEVLKNGTKTLEKKEDEREEVEQEKEEIEGTRSWIAKESHRSLMAFLFVYHSDRLPIVASVLFGF